MPSEVCPNCGADVPRKAKACPECGSDEQTGWSEGAETGHLGLPDDSFDYDEFVEKEFGAKKPIPRGVHWFWWLVGLILLATLGAMWFKWV